MKRITIVLLILFALFVPEDVHAEPIEITDGFIEVRRGGSAGTAVINLTGNNFSLAIGGMLGGSVPPLLCDPGNCHPGTVLSLTSAINPNAMQGEATVNGTFYDVSGGIVPSPGFIIVGGTLNLVSPPVVLPDFAGPTLLIEQDFTLRGTLFGTTQRGPQPVVFSTEVFGMGFVALTLRSVPGQGGYDFENIRYQIGEPVPEPATMLLLGTGLAGIAIRYRTRGK